MLFQLADKPVRPCLPVDVGERAQDLTAMEKRNPDPFRVWLGAEGYKTNVLSVSACEEFPTQAPRPPLSA